MLRWSAFIFIFLMLLLNYTASLSKEVLCCLDAEVTVGTTSFDDLIKEVDSESFQKQVGVDAVSSWAN